MKLFYILIFSSCLLQNSVYSFYNPLFFTNAAAYFFLLNRNQIDKDTQKIQAITMFSIGVCSLLTGISHAAIVYYKYSEKSFDEQEG